MMSVCILCVYALFPFGDFITTSSHRLSHAFEKVSSDTHSHRSAAHHHSHSIKNRNSDIEDVNHEHAMIAFLSAAFDFESKFPDSQKTTSFSLDIHLLSELLDFNPSLYSDSRTLIHSIFHPLIVRFSENATPPPRQ